LPWRFARWCCYRFDSPMAGWLGYALIAMLLWGIVGLFQKLGTNAVSARELIVWLTIGFLVLVPFIWPAAGMHNLGWRIMLIGLAGGLVNGVGSWELFQCLEKGAKASVAIPLTALYPLLTAVLAIVFLKERLSATEWIGVALAIAAGGMLSYEPPPANAKVESGRMDLEAGSKAAGITESK
jgi:transporter family protein